LLLDNSDISKFYKNVENQFIKWAHIQEHIRLAIVVGSRARTDTPADKWSDLDIAIYSTEPRTLIDSAAWVSEFGIPIITFIEPTAGGFRESFERRVLYDNGLDVDFAIDPFHFVLEARKHGLTSERAREMADILGRGVRVLVDKDNIMDAFLKEYKALMPISSRHPTEHEYLERVNDFWYHTVWTAKKLRRGELWEGKSCLDGYMKGRCLLPMIEWQAKVTQGWESDTWFQGRFMERWADPRIIAELQGAFAHYEEEDIWQALANTMQLFRWISRVVAEKLEYTYPHDADQFASRWVDTAYWDRNLND
jgi:aminoglycoside 6-adenylyltransferase